MDVAEIACDALSECGVVTVHDLGQRKCGIVTFTKAGLQPAHVADMFRRQRINVSVSKMPSARLDLEPRGPASLTRASVHDFNTEDEIVRFVGAVEAA